MAVPIICKLLQKQTYDFLSQRYAIVLCFIGSILVIVSAFHFGETMLEWSKDKYVAVFNSFSDNIAGRSFQNRLCSYLPIDVVYTWVNGSDPKLIEELNRVKAEIFLGFNSSGPVKCTYAYCFQSNMVLINPTLPVNYTLSDLAKANPFFLKAMNLAWMKSPHEGLTNQSVSVVVFEDFETVPHVLTEYLLINGRNYSVRETYLTTEWTARNSVLLEDTVILTGIPSELTQELLLQHLPHSVQSEVHKMLFYPEKSLVVVVTNNKDAVEKLLDYDGNFTVGDKEQNIHTANLVFELQDDIINEDVSASRFEDNEELRYSLRSVEKHAPWIRHIYIVTNGQIPYWLALDNPKMTIVTHEEIFLNKSDLPTFSSPAIESHIHRIPGLSQKFIYMNDDVMFGKDVWPEDFYTHSKGQKVYLTWPVPGCKEGCPTSWINDGYCDKPCNNSECDWDGGDCLGGSDNVNAFGIRNNLNFLPGAGDAFSKAYCSVGCTNTWLADRYCDQACNVLACGFDAGDCGLIDFNQLYRLELLHNQTEYTLPQGETIAYFDLKTFLSDIVLTSGTYEENAIIRVIAIIHKYKVLSVLLFSNYNATTLMLTLEGFKKTAEEKVKFTFNLTVDTLLQNRSESVETTMVGVKEEKKEEQNGIVIFEEFPENKRYPKIPLTKSDDLDFFSNIQVDEDQLSEFNKMQIKNLHQKLKDGELTQKGFDIQKARILKNASSWASIAHLEINKPRTINLIYPDNSLKEYNQAEQFYPGLQLRAKNQTHLFKVNLMDGKKKPIESKEKHNLRKSQDQFENKPEHRKLLTLQKHFRNRHPELTTRSYKKEDKPNQQLDTFGDSLRHVNKLLNVAYGYELRKVPGHTPLMIDVEVMHSLHERFPGEFAATSSHRIRTSADMQFAFSYFYFLMSEPKEFKIDDIFNTFDTDNSGTWSDREIRTLVARLYKLPLDYESMMQFENIIINCSKLLPSHLWDNVVTPPLERYHDSKLPTVSKQLVKSCDEIQKMFMKTFSGTKKHKFEIMGEDEISFKMIRNNISWLVGQLDDVRKYPKKFICLNDNMDYRNDVIPAKAVLQDFYESLFPIPSHFELSHEFRNRFLHIDELREWRKYRDLLKLWTHICLIALIIFTLGSFCHNQVVFICRRLMFHRTSLLRGRQNHMLSV